MKRLALCLIATVAVFAQDKPKKEARKPKPAEMDELSKKVVEGWRKREYQPVDAGVKKALFKVKITATGGMMPGTASATYTWDGKKSSMKWDNAQLGGILGQQGWGADVYEGHFDKDAFKKELEGCKLTGRKQEDGSVLITVKSEKKSGPRKLVYDKEGKFSAATQAAPGMGGEPLVIEFTDFTWKKEGEKYLLASFKISFDMPGMGKWSAHRKFEYQQVGGYHVYKRVEQTEEMGGQPAGTKVAEFSDWKFNDDVK